MSPYDGSLTGQCYGEVKSRNVFDNHSALQSFRSDGKEFDSQIRQWNQISNHLCPIWYTYISCPSFLPANPTQPHDFILQMTHIIEAGI